MKKLWNIIKRMMVLTLTITLLLSESMVVLAEEYTDPAAETETSKISEEVSEERFEVKAEEAIGEESEDIPEKQQEEESEEEPKENIVEFAIPENMIGRETLDVSDTDKLQEAYLANEFGLYDTDVCFYNNSDKMTGISAIVYDRLTTAVDAVADGTSTYTKVTIPLSELGLDGRFYAADLGVDAIVVDGNYSDELPNAIAAKFGYEPIVVAQAALRDHPYEFYWATSSYFHNYPMSGYIAKYDNDRQEYYLIFLYDFYFAFPVGAAYASTDDDAVVEDGYTYTTDVSKTAIATVAKGRAQSIVAAAAGKTDYEKLDYYLQQVVALTDYNYSVLDESYDGDSTNPWQLVWLFDGDANTKVVCEGYAKGFQYLCDLTTFDDPSVWCYSVSGTMAYATGGGGHMWNIIHMDDGKNYLIDPTSCDCGGSIVDYMLFIAKPTAGNYSNGYQFTKNGITYKYKYSTQSMQLYTTAELTLSTEDYAGSSTPDEPEDPYKGVTLEYKWTNLSSSSYTIGENAELYYAVTRPSKITVQIFYGNNSYMKTLISDYEVQTNDQVIKWDLLDKDGEYVDDGIYRFTIIATDSEGNTITAHKWFDVTGGVAFAYKWINLSNSVYAVGQEAELYYAVNKPAAITVEIYNGDNSYLRTLTAELSVGTNDQVIRWDLTDSKGAYVSDGTYRFTIKAVDSQGNMLTAHKWFQVTGNEPLQYKWTNLSSDSYRIGQNADLYYAVNKPATITVEIYYGNNNFLRTIETGKQVQTNDQVVEWNLTDKNGNYVPEGTYRFTIKATDMAGKTITAHKWFNVINTNQK